MPNRLTLTILFAVCCASVMAVGPTMRPYAAEHYSIHLEVDPSSDPNVFEATVEMQLKAKAALSEVVLDTEDLKIKSVIAKRSQRSLVAGSMLFDASDPERLTIHLPSPLKAGQRVSFIIDYTGKIRSEHEGLFKVRDPEDPARGPLLFTQFEANSARAFFPCDDEPYDKATTEVLVTVPTRYDVVSNGVLVGDHKRKRNGRSLARGALAAR